MKIHSLTLCTLCLSAVKVSVSYQKQRYSQLDTKQTQEWASQKNIKKQLYFISDEELLFKTGVILLMELLRYVVLFHGKRHGKTFRRCIKALSLWCDFDPLSVHTKENFEGLHVFSKTADKTSLKFIGKQKHLPE